MCYDVLSPPETRGADPADKAYSNRVFTIPVQISLNRSKRVDEIHTI